MRAIWSDERKFQIWLEIEILACEAMARLGLIPKVGHFLAYGGTMFWFCLLYRPPRTRLAYAIGFIAMGVAIEYIQGWTGYRSFEVNDMVADAIGVVLGWAVALLLFK